MRHVFALFAILACCGVAYAQGPAADRVLNAGLTVRNGDKALTLNPDTLSGLPRRTIEARNETETVKYEGVRLIDVLMQAGVTFGQTMRGPRLASYVVAGAPDGFPADTHHARWVRNLNSLTVQTAP